MRTIGVGVIGWGFMGKTHTHSLRDMRMFYPDMDFDVALVSVCSRNREKAERAMREHGFRHATDDYRELIARDDVDVVSICTPNAMHLEMALHALAAGKHVYIDKPMCMDYAEATKLVDAVRRSGCKLQVAHNNRFFPSTLRARQLVEQGKIGDVLSFSFNYLHSGSIDPRRAVGWKQRREGGVLLDLASHALDLLLYLAGDVEAVLCDMRALYPSRPGPDGEAVCDLGEDQVVCLIRLKNGALGTLEASKIATGTDDELSFSVYGQKGAMRWQLMQSDYLDYFDNDAPEVPLGGDRGFTRISCVQRYGAPGGAFLAKNTIGWDRAHMHSYFAFLDAIVHDGQPSPDEHDAARLQQVMDAMRQSAREGRWIQV